MMFSSELLKCVYDGLLSTSMKLRIKRPAPERNCSPKGRPANCDWGYIVITPLLGLMFVFEGQGRLVADFCGAEILDRTGINV